MCKLVLDIRKEVQWYSIQDSKWKNFLSSQMAVNWHHTNIACLLTSSVVQPPFILWLHLLITWRGKLGEILSCAMMSGRQTHGRWGEGERVEGERVEGRGGGTQPP